MSCPQAFGRCFPEGPQAELSEDDSPDEGAALGVPLDQTKRWRKLARKQLVLWPLAMFLYCWQLNKQLFENAPIVPALQ